MIKPLVLATLIFGAAPFAALADPMSVGGDSSLLAANSVAAPAAGSGASTLDPPAQGDAIDDDAVREPLAAAPEPPASRSAHPPGAGRPSGRAASHPGNAAHKKTEATRWQSLLPGVMK